MPLIVVNGAMLSCDKGVAPGSLTVLPTNQIDGTEKPVGTVDDYKPMVNIPAFGMCTSQTNPQVMTATSAAGGVLTPQPCIPVVTSAWQPGGMSTINEVKVLTENSTCNCQWAGTIRISNSGQSIIETD